MRLALLTLLLAASASAQSLPDSAEVGRIAGVVTWDETAEPLIGAIVFLVGTTTGAATGLDGRFVIEGVPVGTHVVRVSYVGFVSVEVRDVVVRAGETVWRNADLEAQPFDCEPWICYDPVAHPVSAYAARRVVHDARGTDRCYPTEGMTEAVAR